MGYADLIASKVAVLPSDRQAEVLRYVEAVAGELANTGDDSRTEEILRRAWGAWGQASREEIDRALAAQRDEWERELPRTDV